MGIREVAERAQTSIATVSQVLNGKGSFSDRTRERVLAAAAELGYRPNPTAAALGAGRASGRLNVIGLAFSYSEPITFSLTDSDYFSKVIAAATEQALSRGYALVVGPPTPQTQVWLRLPFDGVTVVDPVVGDSVPSVLRDRRTPLVVIGRDPEASDDVRVWNDPQQVLRAALDHLETAGAVRPALYAYPLPDAFVADIRRSYSDWCTERRLEPVEWLMYPERAELVSEQIGASLVEPGAPDSVVCLEDDLATAIEAIAQDRQVAVPEDLQIVAVSDRSSFPGIALTTVELNPAATGRAAVDALVDLIETGSASQRVTEIPVRVVPRDSTL